MHNIPRAMVVLYGFRYLEKPFRYSIQRVYLTKTAAATQFYHTAVLTVRTNMGLRLWQTGYILGAAAAMPLLPFLLIQARITRWKVGVLPEAKEPDGVTPGKGEATTLLVLGESTAAGLGAEFHENALAGRFALRLAERFDRPVSWTVVAKNGVTARRTIDELFPNVPERPFDHILLAIGGNDVMKLSSPIKWRRDMIELLGKLREHSPGARIYISNCPMIKYSPALPQPIKGMLWGLSRMHNANIREFSAEMDRVQYYPQPDDIDEPGFFADGIHPSEQGYSDWAGAMAEYFFRGNK